MNDDVQAQARAVLVWWGLTKLMNRQSIPKSMAEVLELPEDCLKWSAQAYAIFRVLYEVKYERKRQEEGDACDMDNG